VLHTGIAKMSFESTDVEGKTMDTMGDVWLYINATSLCIANLKAILEELRVFGKANNLKCKFYIINGYHGNG
jgi:hypothetical protein